MPITTVPEVPRYNLPPTTSCELDWADLPFVDLSKTQTLEGRIQLVEQIRDALSTTGFFYAINHGYSSEQTQRMIDIGDIPFTQVSDDEKAEYENKLDKTGMYRGYKPRSSWHIENGVRDQIEHYNLKTKVTKDEHPKALRPFLPEIAAFAEHNHFNILHPILRLIALGLELPEGELLPVHDFEGEIDSWVSFMKYYPHSEADSKKTKNLWLNGHTDISSISILWSQPVSALQVRSPDGRWRWVKHVENAVIINAGDWLEVYSAGHYKAIIHRVVQPPPDQHRYNRLGLCYFPLPNDDVRVTPKLDAPLLQRIGFDEFYKGEQFMPGLTMKEYRIARTSSYGQVKLKKGATEGTEENVVGGVTVKHYS